MLDEKERLAALEREVQSVKELLLRMEAKMDGWHQNFIPRAETVEMLRTRDTQIDHNSSRIQALEANQTWLWRTVGGAVVIALMAGVYLARV